MRGTRGLSEWNGIQFLTASTAKPERNRAEKILMKRPYLFFLAIGSGLVAAPALKSLLREPEPRPPVVEQKVIMPKAETPEASGRPAPPQALRIVGSGESGSQTQGLVPRFDIPPPAP